MKRNALHQVVRLRRVVLDEAIQDFAECLRKETEAGQTLRTIEAAIAREVDKAGDLDGSDAMVEAFGTWFRRARDDLQTATTGFEQAQADTARARAVMSAARSALEAAESLNSNRQAEANRIEEHHQQNRLDDLAQRRR